MIPIRGLFETHLTVMHLERAVSFYRDVIGLKLAYLLPERQVAFFWIGARGNAMLGLWCVGSAPLSMALHIAFDVALADLLTAPERLNAAGVTPRGFNGEPVAEPVVIGWMPAAALYFKDPDGHSLEYLAMLPQQSKAEIGVVTYARWQAMHAPQG